MNKWIETYMEEHDLEPNELFEIVQERNKCKYFFREDGLLCRDVGTGYECVNYHTLGSIMDGTKIEKVKPKGKYIPKKGEKYYYITAYGAIDEEIYNCEKDEYLFSHDFVFRTLTEAKDYMWFLEQVDKYKKEFVYGECNHCFEFYKDIKELILNHYKSIRSQGMTYFGSRENIDEFRNVVGDERIKKYFFGVFE